jgi:APA family basic amino acid/polyamine antiporter
MLKKGISLFGVFSLASGAMISSGIFILPGLAFAKTGPSVFISYLLAGILGLVGIFSVIELTTAMPRTGGDYFFVNKIFGPLFGTFSGFLGWFALSLKSAFAIFGIAEITHIYTGFNPLLSGLILTVFFVVLNLVGVKEAAVFQVTMVAGLLLLLVAYIVAGLPRVEISNFRPMFTGGYNEVLITAGFIFISFGGLLNIASIAEEVKNPSRNIPLGMLSSIIVVTILYTLITLVITGTLEAEVFKESLTPVADSARAILGTPGYLAIIIASTLAFFTTANAGIMSASRYPMALARDRLIPPVIANVNKKFKTPTLSIVITGMFIYATLLLPLELLVKAASTVILTSYVLTNVSVIIMRESKLVNYKPTFKAPLYPWLQIFSVLIFSFFIIDLGAASVEISLAFIFLSFCVYMFYGRKIKDSEFALLHMMKTIVDKRLKTNNMEDELREILVDRDEIHQDNFDRLVKKAEVLDIDEHIDFETLLSATATGIAEKTGMEEDEIIKRFIARQEESNTAVSPFLAVPHIVIDGTNKMFLTIVRCRSGVTFTDDQDNVSAIFILGGTEELRTLHLEALASIATMVSQADFKEKWDSATNEIEIKNLIILGNRKRHT